MIERFLWANAGTCLGFGAVFAGAPIATADFIGDPPAYVVVGLGTLLLINALLLGLTAWRWTDRRAFIAFFVLGDAGWVGLTVALLALGVWINGLAAIFASICVAGMVGMLGFGQYYYGLRPKDQRNG